MCYFFILGRVFDLQSTGNLEDFALCGMVLVIDIAKEIGVAPVNYDFVEICDKIFIRRREAVNNSCILQKL